MADVETQGAKGKFKEALAEFAASLHSHVETEDKEWTVKGFIDVYENIYTISADTKVVSKILEIHLFPKIIEFARENDLCMVLADHQNYYPDISFVHKSDDSIRYALDLKSTYRLEDNPEYCNGFTLGSHGEYFVNRTSKKNIQFPYSSYLGHFCLGVIYSRRRKSSIDETIIHTFDQLASIASVVGHFQFFSCEKWEIASDRSGSGNTANIGSIDCVDDILAGRGMFLNLGEQMFDEYWMNYGRMIVKGKDGKPKKLSRLHEFLRAKSWDPNLVNPRRPRRKRKSE